MNNTREYKIIINGVEQSVKAVDALLQKIDALDDRISKLSKLSIDLGAIQNSVKRADNGGSKYDAAKSEAAAQKEIANQIALQNAENQKALQLLVQKKQETKEQVKIQQQIAQGVRDTNGEYANTLNGQRALLSEMKKQIGNMDIDDAGTRAFAEQINQVTEKIKEMEEAYGTFTRNVGNYKSAAEGFQGFNVTIGETVRNFGSLREAAKTIKNEMMGIDTTTAEGRAQFEAYEQALHDVTVSQAQMADAADRAASSSKGLHDALEMMEGLTAVAGIGQGVSSLFGLDSTALGEQITKLQSLMTIMQSIKTLQDQMERGVGGGGWIAKLWKGLDHPIASLKKLSAGLRTAKTDIAATGTAAETGAVGMKTFSTATTAATVAVKAFAKATIILAVLQLIAEAIGWVVDGFKELIKVISNPAYESQERAMNNIETSADAAADALAAYNDELERQVTAGIITPIEASVQAIDNFEKKLDDNVTKLRAWARNLEDEDMMNDLTAMFSKKSADEAIANLQAMEAQLKNMDPATEEFNNQMNLLALNTIRSMQEVNLSGSDELAKFINALNSSEFGQTAMQKFMDSLPEESRASFQNVLDNFYSMADQMANRAAQLTNEVTSYIRQLQNEFDKTFNPEKYIHNTYEAERQRLNEYLKAGKITLQTYDQLTMGLDAREADELAKTKKSEERKTATVQSGGRARIKATKSAGRARVSAAKNTANELEAVEKRIQNDKIQTMREGLAKTLAQLDLEKRNRIEQAQKLRKLGKKGEEKYQEEMASITALYAKKEFDAKKEWADKWNDYQNQVARQLEQRRRAYTQLELDYKGNINQNWFDKKNMNTEVVAIKNLVRQLGMADEQMQKIIKESGLGDLLDKYIKEPTEDTLKEIQTILDKFNLNMKKQFNQDGTFQYKVSEIIDSDEYYKTLKRINEIKARMLELTTHLKGDADLDAIEKEYRALEAEQKKLYENLDISKMPLSNPEELFNKWQTYYDMMYRNQKQFAEKTKALRLEEIDEEERTALYDEFQEYSNIRKDIEEQYKQHRDDMKEMYDRSIDDKKAQLEGMKKTQEEIKKAQGEESDAYKKAVAEYDALSAEQVALVEERDKKLVELEEWRNTQIGWFAEKYNEANSLIQKNFNEQRLKAENDFIRESQTATANYYSGLLNELQVFQNKFQQKVEKLPEKTKNAWGIVDLTKYSKGINEFKTQFQKMVKNIEKEQKKLIIKLANNEISLGDFNTAYNELEGLKEEANETLENLTNMGKNKIGEFIESINTYIQAVGQGVQELLSTVWDAQSAALDAQQEALEKANSELEKQLDKQQQITQRHADKINQIEDELSTARGDRRQHLIDSLSAQIAAQRASLAAEQRIQKQKEANEKKQDALDKKRKEAQRKQDITSAIISTALATANGFATKPFVPVGIAMGALAAALGAAQVAIIASKHYAKGGLLEGPSHSQGGIPVGNTGIEVEGKEYIVNKRSTAKNFGLIEYINRSNKQLDINDIMAYFDSAASRSVKGVRSKFADGGQLPTLNDNVEVVNPSQTIIFNQDDRPIWVSVKDINDAQARVRNVQTLAGMR